MSILVYDTKQSDGEVPVMLELWWMCPLWSTLVCVCVYVCVCVIVSMYEDWNIKELLSKGRWQN